MEIESEKKDKDINKTQNEREIERLNRKLKRVMEEYAKCAKERDELRAAINVAKRKKGRPGLSTEKKAKICTLYQQGNQLRRAIVYLPIMDLPHCRSIGIMRNFGLVVWCAPVIMR